MVTRTVLAMLSAAAGLLFMQQGDSSFQAGEEAPSVSQRYRAEVENAILEQGAGEVIETLKTLQSQLTLNDQAMKEIAANVDEANKVLGGINQTLDDIVEKKITNGKFVSMQEMESAIKAVKEAATEAAKTTSTEDDGTGCNCNKQFVEIIQRLEALEAVTGLATSMYGQPPTSSSGGLGSFGSTKRYNAAATSTTIYGTAPATSGGGSFGNPVQASQDTRHLRVIERRQPRQVTDYEVPVANTEVNVVETPPATCTMRDPITGECLQSTAAAPVAETVTTEQGRFPLLNRLRGKR